jgi:hypothetical protein
MKSWASIVSNTPSIQTATRGAAAATAATAATAAATAATAATRDRATSLAFIASDKLVTEKQQSVAFRPFENSHPSHKTLIRPDAPTVVPIYDENPNTATYFDSDSKWYFDSDDKWYFDSDDKWYFDSDDECFYQERQIFSDDE